MHSQKIAFQDPLRVYERLFSPDSVLLESQKKGRYSYIATDPYMVFKSRGRRIEIIRGEKKTVKTGDPLKELRRLIKSQKEKRKPGWPMFFSGAIGYISYDLVRLFEKIPEISEDELGLYDLHMIFPENIVAFDHLKKTMTVLSKTGKGLEDTVKNIKEKKTKGNHPAKSMGKAEFKSNFTYPQYKKAVEKCREYVLAGDSFQIKISQMFSCKISEDPLTIYGRLRKINPSPYAALVNFGECQMISCSPEHLVKIEKGVVETRPIGGTYPRGKNRAEDLKIARNFMSDEKERAEHTMLIDLERNDMGRVCAIGSVKVNEFMSLEKYSHLMHIVTNIRGKLAKGRDVFDVLRAMFPGGTITGCPKIRTMEIIDEIEPTRRGPYTGSIGFITAAGEMDLNIIIRTLLIKDGVGYIQVGGGIVADSNQKREYEETVDKAKALFEAVGGK